MDELTIRFDLLEIEKVPSVFLALDEKKLNEYLDKYKPQIVEQLENGVSPDWIIRGLHLSLQNNKQPEIETNKQTETNIEKEQTDATN